MSERDEELKNRLFFSLENLYGIFETKDISSGVITNNSKDYRLNYLDTHRNSLITDVIKKISYIQRTGMLSLNTNNVVCIKINGLISCYRYMGVKTNNPERFFENFVEVKRFVNREMEEKIENLHRDNKVVGAVDGRVYHIDELENQKLYALDYEVFRKENNLYNATSNYVLYGLDQNGRLQNTQPDSKSFTMIQNALYYFYKAKQKDPAAVLLFNRKELEIVNDYYQLNGLMA